MNAFEESFSRTKAIIHKWWHVEIIPCTYVGWVIYHGPVTIILAVFIYCDNPKPTHNY